MPHVTEPKPRKLRKNAKHRPHAPRRLTELGAMKVLDPIGWERTIRATLKKYENNISRTAEEFGLSLRQMFRILSDPRFDDVERVNPGPPRGARE